MSREENHAIDVITCKARSEEKMKKVLKTLLCGAALAAMTSVAVMAQDAGNITLGFPGGVGPTDVPAILALEELKTQGWTADYMEFDSPDIQTQALLNGDIQVASMGPATVFAANLAGADLRIVSNNNSIDFIVLAKTGIETCADLNGQIVAYHSTGSTTTAHLKRYITDNCPDIAPNYMVLSGSANRAAALLNGQIAGTIVRMEDWIAATGGADERAKILALLAETQSTLLTQTIVVSAKNVNAKRGEIEAFVDALQNQFAKVYENPVAYAERAVPYLDGASVETVSAVYEALVDAELFPKKKALSRAQIEDTIAFYEQAGRADAGVLTPESVADFSISDR